MPYYEYTRRILQKKLQGAIKKSENQRTKSAWHWKFLWHEQEFVGYKGKCMKIKFKDIRANKKNTRIR